VKKIISLFVISLLTLITCAAYATVESQSELNKKDVVAFYDEVINQKNFDAALKYIGTRYTQHNPTAADGTEGLRNYIQFLRDKYPYAHSEIKRVFAEADFVLLHVHLILEPNTRGLAIVDIFKLEKDKIVEHWDVIQAIPEKSANDNGMF
jgi:predicted SnoaL-like aldol condensation-catalyzing enzyme